MQPHVTVFITVFRHEPRKGRVDGHVEFFAELALERVPHRFPVFELAARKFPVSGIGLSFGARTDEHGAVFPDQHAAGDFNDFFFRHSYSRVLRVIVPRQPQ